MWCRDRGRERIDRWLARASGVFEGLVDGAAADVAVEEIADLFSGEAVVCSL